MADSKITHKVTQGMYILTALGGGCVVDAVMYAGSDDGRPVIAVSVAKKNHSHQLLSTQDKFALSVLGENTDPTLIQTFGFQSSRDADKFADIDTTEVAGVPIISKSLGYMVMEKIDTLDNDTHTVFFGRMIEGKVLEDTQPMSYAYYSEHKDDLAQTNRIKHENDLKKTPTDQGKTAWICTACGYIYYGDEVPDDFICPLCGLGKDYFKKQI